MHAVVTGGEPLCHSVREDLLESLGAVRKELKPLLTVLRTNLAFGEDDHLLHMLAECTDEVVVSVDGDESTHDERRGEGSYERTTENLLKLMRLKPSSDISIATVLPFDLASGAPGESVRKLAKDLGIRRIRFRPLLPL